MSEYYIRTTAEDETRGPYDLGKLSDLIEPGVVTRTALYYDDAKEEWFRIEENPTLFEALSPKKKRLSLKAKEDATPEIEEVEEVEDVSVDEMLAAAEGLTDETHHLKEEQINQGRAARICLPGLAILLLFSAILNLLPEFSTLNYIFGEGKYASILSHTVIILGLVDLFLALCCFLSVTDVFPIIRFREMLGLGYFTYIYWAWGDVNMLLATLVASIAIYICTLTLNLSFMIACLTLGGLALLYQILLPYLA